MTPEQTTRKAEHPSAEGGGAPFGRLEINPVRDWLLGLAGATLLSLVGAGGAGYLFWSKSTATTDTYEVTVDAVQFDSKLLDRVLTKYRARHARYELLGTTATTVDTAPQATSTMPVAR